MAAFILSFSNVNEFEKEKEGQAISLIICTTLHLVI